MDIWAVSSFNYFYYLKNNIKDASVNALVAVFFLIL